MKTFRGAKGDYRFACRTAQRVGSRHAASSRPIVAFRSAKGFPQREHPFAERKATNGTAEESA
jgi:hypothetical protein